MRKYYMGIILFIVSFLFLPFYLFAETITEVTVNLPNPPQVDADINGEYISYHNVVITANNSLNYYDLMMYGKYDLVVSSYAEALEMKTYFTLNNIRYVELYLDGISKPQAEAVFSGYSCYSSSSDSHRLFLLK